MAIKFRKRFEIDLPVGVVGRLAKYMASISESKNVTGHWQSRERHKLDSFEVVDGTRLFYTQMDNGLDDYYPANFGRGPILTLQSRIKRAILRRLRRPDPLAIDPLLNYQLSKYRSGRARLLDLDHLDLRNPNWAGVRAVLVANMIDPYLVQNKIKPQTILEIGPGSGNLLYCFKKLYPGSTAIFVDLPSSLLFSIANMLSKSPKSKFLLPNEVDATLDATTLDFLFLRDDQVGLIPDRSVDLMFNTVSFAEMRGSVVERYFELLRRVARPSNLFYCLNRVEKNMEYDGKVEPIRFHEYPWVAGDQDMFYRMSEVETPLTTGGAFFERLCRLSNEVSRH